MENRGYAIFCILLCQAGGLGGGLVGRGYAALSPYGLAVCSESAGVSPADACLKHEGFIYSLKYVSGGSVFMIENELVIRKLVKMAVEAYAGAFETRHIAEYNTPHGTINMKIHNVFIAALGPEIQYYTALVRSLDSSRVSFFKMDYIVS